MRLAATLGVLTCAVAWLGIPDPACAAHIFEDIGILTAFDIDPSVRSLAMGGASGAVFWGSTTNHWANPALLGLNEGIAYEDAAAGDIPYDAHGWTLGQGGVGFAIGGRPLSGFSGIRLPELAISEEIRTWGVGASLSGIVTTIAGLRHSEPPALTRHIDVAVGYNRKRLENDQLNGVNTDWGMLARGTLPFRLGPGAIPARLEAAYAYSVQNANDGDLGPVRRPHRHSVSTHFGLDLPPSWRDRLPTWLAPGFEPLVSLGGAWDREFISVGSGPNRSDLSHLGGELGLGNVAFVRMGDGGRHVWGYGLGLPIGRLGGYRYDEARVPESDGFPAIKSHGWSVWMNLVEISRAVR